MQKNNEKDMNDQNTTPIEKRLFTKKEAKKMVVIVMVLVLLYFVASLTASVYAIVQIARAGAEFGPIIMLIASGISSLITVFALYGLLTLSFMQMQRLDQIASRDKDKE